MSFVPYQVDYTETGKGKTLGFSKKKISFKFGFANRKALADGLSGSNCRGSEHEVVYIWSMTSGKRHILADGHEVHFSQTDRRADRTFNCPFALRVPGIGQLQCRIIAESGQGVRPFDLRINNMSYFHFSKIYELGKPSMRVGQLTHQNYVNDEASAPPEERRLIAQAKLESMRELRAMQERQSNPPSLQEAPKMEREEPNLLTFDDDDAGVPAQGSMYHASSITLDTALHSPSSPPANGGYNQSTGQQQQQYQQQQQPYTNYSISNAGQQPYTNYSVSNPYGVQPQFQQEPAPASYSQAPAPYAQAPAPYAQAPAPYAQAPAPYAQAPATYSQPYQPSGSFGSQQQMSYTSSAPAPTFEETQASYGTQSSYGAPPPFASPQSQMSYGSSAPAFAQPPKTPAPAPANYGGYGY